MTNPNQHPNNPEQETFVHQEIVQFSDGEMALGFREQGDKLPLGYGSGHKYARSFDTIDMALIATKSGNTYGLAKGLIINKNTQSVYGLPPLDIDVTIGEPCTIPGVGSTSDVESVMLRYKVDTPGSSMADQQVDAPSPFTALEAQVDSIIDSSQQA